MGATSEVEDGPPAGDVADGPDARTRRADAARNHARILAAAAELLRTRPDASTDEIAASAGVSRATVYRHFSSRSELLAAAARGRTGERAKPDDAPALRPAGELGGGPTPLDVAEVLDTVPPHLMGDQIVSEAQRLAQVTSVALYLVDIDGTQLLRLAGSEEFPPELELPLAVGPEIPTEGLAGLRASIDDELPGTVMAPLMLRGRAIGVLLAVDAPEDTLLELAHHGAAALALADAYTDVFDGVRRRKETSAASEIQQNLLPPRVARISGGIIAGNVLPGYDIGGDWFDYAENRDGAWLGVADSLGRGAMAAAIGAVALGAFRAKRKVSPKLEEAALGMHHAIQALEFEDALVNTVLGRWHGPSSTFRWITCGHQPPLLLRADGELVELTGTDHPALGRGDAARAFAVDRRRLEPGERLVLVSDGVLDRRTTGGEAFGIEGVRAAIADVVDAAAPPSVRAIERALTRASADPLEDDATIVVFAPTGAER